jgi:hypothetical protein
MSFRLLDSYSQQCTYSNPAMRWPDVNFGIRVALPARVEEYRLANRSTGQDSFRAKAKLILDQLDSWDVEEMAKGDWGPAQITEIALKHIPTPIIDFMADCICGYAPVQAQADVKN